MFKLEVLEMEVTTRWSGEGTLEMNYSETRKRGTRTRMRLKMK